MNLTLTSRKRPRNLWRNCLAATIPMSRHNDYSPAWLSCVRIVGAAVTWTVSEWIINELFWIDWWIANGYPFVFFLGRSLFIAVSNPLLVEQQPSGKEYSNDPVFYGPDGKILSEEESAFLWGATQPSNDYYDEEEEYVQFLAVYLCNLTRSCSI